MKKQEEKKINFFNKQQPIIIALCIISVLLLIKCYKLKTNGTLYVAKVEEKELLINNIHYFITDKVNYFYSDSVNYLGEDHEIYNYEIGYYVNDGKTLIPLAVRTGGLDKKMKLSEIIPEITNYNVAELSNNHKFFKKGILPHLEDLHFVIKASSEQNNNYDISLDYKLSIINMNK